TAEVCRRHGISEETIYRGKSKYVGMEPRDAQRLKRLEDENRQLKKLLAQAMLAVAALKDLPPKTESARAPADGGAPADVGARLPAASGLQADRSGSEDRSTRAEHRRACQRLRELAGQRRRFGYRRLGILLAREGMTMNHKKLYQLYREEGLAVRRRRGRKR